MHARVASGTSSLYVIDNRCAKVRENNAEPVVCEPLVTLREYRIHQLSSCIYPTLLVWQSGKVNTYAETINRRVAGKTIKCSAERPKSR